MYSSSSCCAAASTERRGETKYRQISGSSVMAGILRVGMRSARTTSKLSRRIS
ncbi:hypothetical protein [Selenomonas felix]|uniref:hypothetical protein n=1 Tax=Selenomonas felix TaxID=1944634 RepID=UPI00235458C5|nr:hypothetical protein [Selenomonas felix]